MLKVRTLFSGIGSPEIALRDLEIPFELVDFCEVDKYAVKSYCAVHGVDPSKNLGDITKVWGRDLPYADLLVWGFPCTDISVAGKQKGIVEGETRSGLYYEGLRILKETKPKYSIIENVKNLTGKKFKAEFEQMLKDIEELGYNNYWKVLNAADYGIPQNRERVFIVSIRKDVDKVSFEFPLGFDNGLRLKDFLEDEVDEKYYLSEKMLQYFEKHKEKHQSLGNGFGYKPKDLSKNGIASTIANPSRNQQSDNYIIVKQCIDGNGRTDDKSINTLTATYYKGAENYGTRPFIMENKILQGAIDPSKTLEQYRIRKLSPKECWRLMFGLEADKDFEKAKAAGISDSQLYKQAGNSIVSNVLAAIFKNLLQTEISQIYEVNKILS